VVFVVLVISVQINMICKNIFSPDVAEQKHGEFVIPATVVYLGAYTNTYLDLIGMGVTCSFMLVVIFGIK
jgi:hypothetical protein